jgi:acyl-phosphate glycerol 3-phosphate acyltransferase
MRIMDWLPVLLMPLAGYLVGSIPFGYLVARARGVDIFKHGSGNIGATNVGRVLGRPFGVLVFVLDFAKGALPVAAAVTIAAVWPTRPWWRDGWLEVLTGLAAFLGHLFPLYLGLHGGKGVATGTGVVAVMLPGPALAAFATWILAVLAWRFVSVASILAVTALVTVQLAGTRDPLAPRSLFCILASALVLLKHRGNIVRLAQGRENQIRETLFMTRVNKSLHVLAVGLWFGAAVFFTFVVAFSLFGGFEQLADDNPRPAWFPSSHLYDRKVDAINARREQGTRAAGFAITPMFTWYFLMQLVCGFVALATALPWSRLGSLHRWRLTILLTAVFLVLAGWPLERWVEELRHPRNGYTDAYLQDPTEEKLEQMRSARAEFGTWHGVSVMLNLGVLVCITAAAALAGHLPADRAGQVQIPSASEASDLPAAAQLQRDSIHATPPHTPVT